MPRTKRDPSADKDKRRYAREWKTFRKKNKISQQLLAEVTNISRRTIQSIEAAKEIPQKATLDKFEQLRERYRAEGKPTGQRKQRKVQPIGDLRA